MTNRADRIDRADRIERLLAAEASATAAAVDHALVPAFGVPLFFLDRSRTTLPIVNGLYAGILGRLPDPSGQASWTAYLDQGGSAAWMGFELLDSDEGRRQDPERQGSVLAVLRRADLLERLPILRERGLAWFFQRPAALDALAAYLVALGRCPGSVELDESTARLEVGLGVPALLAGMAAAPEGQRHLAGNAEARRRVPWASSPDLVPLWAARVGSLRADLSVLAEDPDCLWIPLTAPPR